MATDEVPLIDKIYSLCRAGLQHPREGFTVKQLMEALGPSPHTEREVRGALREAAGGVFDVKEDGTRLYCVKREGASIDLLAGVEEKDKEGALERVGPSRLGVGNVNIVTKVNLTRETLPSFDFETHGIEPGTYALRCPWGTRDPGDFHDSLWEETVMRRLQDVPGVVGTHGMVTLGKFRDCLLMDLISGPTLDEVLQEKRGAALRAIDASLVETLEGIFRHGVLHQDLHLENVMVDASANPVVIDFSEAIALPPRRSRTLWTLVLSQAIIYRPEGPELPYYHFTYAEAFPSGSLPPVPLALLRGFDVIKFVASLLIKGVDVGCFPLMRMRFEPVDKCYLDFAERLANIHDGEDPSDEVKEELTKGIAKWVDWVVDAFPEAS